MSPDLGFPLGHKELIRRIQAQKAAEAAAQQAKAAAAQNEPNPRARLRAARNEMTGQFYALSQEDRVAFTQHCEAILSDLAPHNSRERWLAVSIAEDQWRLNRARALENNIFAIGMSTEIADSVDADSPETHAAICQARVWLQDGKNLQLLSLYEQRIRRSIEKNERQLKELQTERKATEDKAREEAILLAQLAIAENRDWNPAEDAAAGSSACTGEGGCAADPGEYGSGRGATGNGFAFSKPEILRLAHRELRLRKARLLQNEPRGKRPKAA